MTICALLEDLVAKHRRSLLLALSLFGIAATATARNELTAAETELCLNHAAPLAGPESPDYRQYAPDRKVDILHLALDVTPDFKQRTIRGTAVLTFKPIARALDELRLDAVDLNIHSVTATVQIAAHQSTENALIITFTQPIAADKEVTVTIEYDAQPELGIYFRTPEMGYKPDETHLFSQGESIEARHWYPGFDAPNEKFTSEITCHVPDGMTVLSNGKLVGSTRDAAGLTAVHWSQDKPHVNYLLTLVAGYFKKVEDKYRDIPLEFYVPPSDIAEALGAFKDTKAAMEFFEKDIGVPYAWAKYGQVCIRDFHWGGMENTSMTTLTDRTLHRADTENLIDSEGLVSHELAHQWFGDLVTCKDWSHAWLNEGFATYYALLFTGHKNGRETMLAGLYNDLKGITSHPDDTQPIVSRKYKEPEDRFRMYGYLIYPKGGWVLHMLRSQLGDDLYRRCIKTYLERHQYDTVVTEDLRAVIEELSGRSYDRFFDQWVYHAHHPELEVNYSWDEKTKLAKVSIKQVQKISEDVALFNFPLTLRFKSKSGTKDLSVTVSEKEQDFYCPLAQAPEIVRIDPELTVLAKITFKLPNPMLYAQLADKTDMLGRWLAIEQLAEKKDHGAVAKLKEALNNDSFFGIRTRASEALRTIHSDEALEALLASTKQGDARVRSQVMNDITGFYSASVFDAAKKTIASEKNPIIQATAIRTLGAYGKADVRDTLLKYLDSDSYRQRLAEAAIGAIRAQDDQSYITPLRDVLAKQEGDFNSFGFGGGLDALAYLARNLEKKDEVRNFLTGYVNHKKDRVRLAAINALGTLEDPKAIAVLEKFTNAAKDSPERQAAEKAVATLNGAKKSGDNLKDLRNEIMELQKNDRELRKQLEDLKKKLEATGTKAPALKSKK